MNATLSASAQRVQAALQAGGFDAIVIEHEQSTRTAKEAADAVGCQVAQIAKSLIFRTRPEGEPVLLIVSGKNRVDEALVQAAIGSAIEKPDADFVLAQTGFAIGGVPPLGHRAPLRTYIDEDLLALAEIWAAAGTPNAVFRTSPADLRQMSGGAPLRVHA